MHTTHIKIQDDGIENEPEKLWPFKLMEIGDSFWVEGIPRKLQQLLVKQQRRDGRKYRTKAEGIGLRIWRVE